MRCLEGTRSRAEDGGNCLGRSGSSRSNKDGNDPPNSCGKAETVKHSINSLFDGKNTRERAASGSKRLITPQNPE